MPSYTDDLLKALKPVRKELGKSGKILTKPDPGQFFGWTLKLSWKLTVLILQTFYYSAKKLAGRYQLKRKGQP